MESIFAGKNTLKKGAELGKEDEDRRTQKRGQKDKHKFCIGIEQLSAYAKLPVWGALLMAMQSSSCSLLSRVGLVWQKGPGASSRLGK